ncbi:DUF2975 domain-containing protein [Chryseobacterium gwangjuense]|uniref:DUF2975 domain-containing protein n=1 Tax=Chryseobacterium gwangjuense TaxID=1069980 RepID=UPI001E5961C0|nr:DUF2975 domain-containing protein [Chryseobacterium gwangjuense]MCE3077174.1 DUF2975 domain-containing protein [Chryseobacterium gwangjuense]
MKLNSNLILEILKIFFWIFTAILCIAIFVLVCIFFSTVFGINIGSLEEIKINVDFFNGKIKDIQSLGKLKSVFILAYSIILGILQLIFFLTVIKILKRLKSDNTFSMETYFLISKIAKLALLIGSVSFLINVINELITGNISISADLNSKNFQFFLVAGVIYIIAQVYKRAVDLQAENDLTI